MMRRRGQGQTEYIILIGLISLVLLAAVRHFAFAVDEAIEGSVRALRRHEKAEDYAIDTDGDGKKDKGQGVHVGYLKGTKTKVFDVAVESTPGANDWHWEYHSGSPTGPKVPDDAEIVSKKNITDETNNAGG